MKRIKNQKIEEFLQDLGSGSPTPGGGAAAALTASVSSALVEMVCNLTIGKKGYDAVQKDLKRIKNEVVKIKKALIDLADLDVEAFNLVMAAYKMPKENPGRAGMVQRSLKKATEVPLKVAALCLEIEKVSKEVIKKGNKNAHSDARTAAHLAKAARASAIENVRINLKFLKDERYKKSVIPKLSPNR